MPKIDAVIISHNHYDHLDYNSVVELNKKFGNEKSENGLNWFVGLGLYPFVIHDVYFLKRCLFSLFINIIIFKGTAKWFDSIGIKNNVHELNWWQSKKFKNLEFVFTPSQHWCGRGIADRNNVTVIF